MMDESMYDLAFAFDGDRVRLEQSTGPGEVAVVDLHPSQLRLLAERAGLLPPGSNGIAARRLRTVRDKLGALVGADYFRGELLDRCHLGSEFLTELDSICDLAEEFLRDLGAETIQSPPPVNLLRRLQRILDDADRLFQLLARTPSFPPSDAEDEDVARARRLVEDIEDLMADLGGTADQSDEATAPALATPTAAARSAPQQASLSLGTPQ